MVVAVFFFWWCLSALRATGARTFFLRPLFVWSSFAAARAEEEDESVFFRNEMKRTEAALVGRSGPGVAPRPPLQVVDRPHFCFYSPNGTCFA